MLIHHPLFHRRQSWEHIRRSRAPLKWRNIETPASTAALEFNFKKLIWGHIHYGQKERRESNISRARWVKKSMKIYLGKQCYLLFLPATLWSWSRNLEGLFELTQRPSRALGLSTCNCFITSETQLQGHVRCGAVAAEFTGHCQNQLTQTLIVHLLKTHLFLLLLKLRGTLPVRPPPRLWHA